MILTAEKNNPKTKTNTMSKISILERFAADTINAPATVTGGGRNKRSKSKKSKSKKSKSKSKSSRSGGSGSGRSGGSRSGGHGWGHGWGWGRSCRW